MNTINKEITLPDGRGIRYIEVAEISTGHIMTGPISSAVYDGENQPPHQPAINMTAFEAEEFAQKLGGRLPTEEEWLKMFNLRPYFGGILEWTSSQECDRRVLRGGSWVNSAGHLRCAFRDSDHPSSRDGSVGFRIMFPKLTCEHNSLTSKKYGDKWIVSCNNCGRQSSASRAQDAMTEFLKNIR